jgi:RimJ/RimL family protein N-acetyltransferase
MSDVDSLEIRRATPDDAAGIAGVVATVVAERVYSAVDPAWTPDEERRYLEGLSPRQAVHVAIDPRGAIVGLQVLDFWSSALKSMAHVGHVGTFMLPAWRGRGVGQRLWQCTLPLAREVGYRKLVIHVRGSNPDAQAFYQRLGFAVCGRLTRQVTIDGVDDDEVVMEMFL